MTAIHASLIVLMVCCCLVAVPLCSVAALPSSRVGIAAMDSTAWDGSFTAPSADTTWYIGGTYPIRWNGGDPSWSVRLCLIDIATWTAEAVIAGDIPNLGAWDWTVPEGITPGAKCVYLENAQATAWIYGPVFIVTNPPPTPTHDVTWGRIKAAYQ